MARLLSGMACFRTAWRPAIALVPATGRALQALMPLAVMQADAMAPWFVTSTI